VRRRKREEIGTRIRNLKAMEKPKRRMNCRFPE
jgi:hypothetical protein